MLERKEQKRYLVISLAVILALGIITVWKRPDYHYVDNTDYAAKQAQDAAVAAAYRQYLASIKTDPAASQQLFQEILTTDDIKNEVQQELQTNQTVTPPVVADSSMNITGNSGQSAVETYLTDALSPLLDFNQKAADYNTNLFGSDPASAQSTQKLYNQSFRELAAAPVPKEALSVQQSLMSAYESYGQLLALSQDYSNGQNTNPWPELYQHYAAMNQSFQDFTKSFNQLAAKYQLASIQIQTGSYAEEPASSGFALVPKAQAFLGLGDMTITIGDIPSLIMDAVKQGLVSSFSQFMSAFLGGMIQRIESNYMIANFLYYSDALVDGQYADDYLNKYVSSQLDRQIVKQLLPQFSCNVQDPALQQVFQAKANQYLGFDPSNIDPSDPNYYQKLAQVGSFLASPQGWEFYYTDLASQTESAAQQSVDRELSSSGLKSPRDTLSGGITSSINSIVSGEKAGIEGIIQLGIGNADTFASAFIAQITQTLVTKFVFSGVTTNPRNPSSIGVLKEQPTCMASAQIAPIVPVNGTQYQQPPAAPNATDLYQQTCAEFPEACAQNTPTTP